MHVCSLHSCSLSIVFVFPLVFDATGRMPSGVLNGNFVALGSLDQCARIPRHEITNEHLAVYCHMRVSVLQWLVVYFPLIIVVMYEFGTIYTGSTFYEYIFIVPILILIFRLKICWFQ